MQEAYTVKFVYQKDDGFYTSMTETVLVDIKGRHEKDNHKLAEKAILSKYRNARIIHVKYQ